MVAAWPFTISACGDVDKSQHFTRHRFPLLESSNRGTNADFYSGKLAFRGLACGVHLMAHLARSLTSLFGRFSHLLPPGPAGPHGPAGPQFHWTQPQASNLLCLRFFVTRLFSATHRDSRPARGVESPGPHEQSRRRPDTVRRIPRTTIGAS
jgi:hypothetical protein